MIYLTTEEKISKFKKRKNKFKDIKENKKNYKLMMPEIEKEYSNYQKLYVTKKNKHNNTFNVKKPNEIQLQNKYNKINDKFYDKQSDRDSLILQIAETESLKEIKNKKNNNFAFSSIRVKTPEKKLNDIKKKAKAKKYIQKKENKNNNIIERNYGKELKDYSNSRNNTATFNEDNLFKKYNEFTFHKEESKDKDKKMNNDDNNYNNNYEENRKGGKVDLFDVKEPNEISDNRDSFSNNKINNYELLDEKRRAKILKLLKLKKGNIYQKRSKFLNISKSEDHLNLPMNKKNNFGNMGKLDKKLLKEIIDENDSPRIYEKNIRGRNNYDYDNSPRILNHSFDVPYTYRKKIIKGHPNIIKKKNNIPKKNKRSKTEDNYLSPNNYIYYSNSKRNKNNILKKSMENNYINLNNSSLTPINKKLMYKDGNKNIISNYYNNNFYNTPIKNYVEKKAFYFGYSSNARSRSLNNSIKRILKKSKKIKRYNKIFEKENCINISLNDSSYNLTNNSFFTENNIFPKYEINSTFEYEYKTEKREKTNNSKYISINLEDLMIIGEKLFDIIQSLILNKKMANQSFEFWNYFYNSELPKEITFLMLNSELKDSIYSINYTLFSILICYDYSFEINLVEKCFSLIKEILGLIINNYIIFCKYIIKKVSKKNKDNKWIYKLNNMLSKKNSCDSINSDSINNNYILKNIPSVEKIIYNTNSIIKNLNMILEYFKSNSNESLSILFKQISQKNYEEINYFYRTFLLREENINGSFLASLYLKNNPNFHTAPKPYITKPNNKKYTLILDLEETLLNFRLKSENKGEGVLKLRPGIFEFLDEIQNYYEIILFAASSQDYAETLIENIEEKKKYFDYKFYRQHNIVIENDFVKDLSRIGRDIDKMIIVDNMSQNYRLHKRNGINIKGFWGENLCDRILYNLKDILINIIKEGGDLRDGLKKYHEEIAEKVTSNIYKYNFE